MEGAAEAARTERGEARRLNSELQKGRKSSYSRGSAFIKSRGYSRFDSVILTKGQQQSGSRRECSAVH